MVCLPLVQRELRVGLRKQRVPAQEDAVNDNDVFFSAPDFEEVRLCLGTDAN